MTTCSAPGKIYLFGEHAVVYGEPAIACTIDLRTHVTAKRADCVTINSDLGETSLDYEVHPYVSACINKMLDFKGRGFEGSARFKGIELEPVEYGRTSDSSFSRERVRRDESPAGLSDSLGTMGPGGGAPGNRRFSLGTVGSPSGVSVEIRSDIPIGSGLGSSAAVTIATLQALNLEFSLGLAPDRIADLGHRIEAEVQGAASPTDTYVSTMGGLIALPSRRKLKLLDCDIVIGDTLQGASPKKTARMVSMVASLRDEFPNIINPIIKTIGSFANLGEKLLEERDYASLGKLVNIDHGMLDALGVGTAQLSNLVYAARSAGAYGAKITGAGGGGCMVALTDRPEEVARAIEDAGGKAIITRATELGVEVE